VVVGSIFGRIGQFLNLTTWYVMKNRSGVVGAGGLAKAVRRIKATSPTLRLHLVGHSLGGRLVAACARSLTAAPAVAVDSLTLLEAAFSHYGFSADNGKGQAGFFRPVVEKRAVRGPLFATFSAQDRVVGKAYALASRLVGDNVQAVGDAGDPYGGIGRNGAQWTAEAVFEPLRRAGGTRYTFPPGKVVNLDGSGGIIKDHSDVTNPHVTFAFACALAQA
jgi:pimeloyl-ACP methyl ester carboxylesterase